jgi:hypothetical protein
MKRGNEYEEIKHVNVYINWVNITDLMPNKCTGYNRNNGTRS